MHRVVFTIGEKSAAVEAEEGETILDAARKAGLPLESPCNGMGVCGKCGCLIDGRRVLACRHHIQGDAKIALKDTSEENATLQILSGGQGFEYPLDPFITEVESYGLAVDIGTTTLVAALINLATGEKAAAESRLNPQAVYAQDVLGRIHFAGNEEGRNTLHTVLIDALRGMIRVLCEKSGVRRERIFEVVYSGNTTMLYLACGFDPAPLGKFPYTMSAEGGVHISAEELALAPDARIWLPPLISAFVGADIVSGILASGLEKREGTTLFIDIGTNGEMVLARNGKLAASSTAAGPAFEGMNITCGMRANRGAIESFNISDGECFFEVIGADENWAAETKIEGICGSGLLDITGCLVRTGAILPSGRFASPAALPPAIAKRFRPLENGKNGFFLTDNVFLNQKDVRQIQLAKGAIRSGVELLLSRFGLAAADLDTVIIAGSFGYHLREESLLNIGLLPREAAGKIAFAGNTSLSGAIAFLLNKQFRSEMGRLIKNIEKVELANDGNFEKTFVLSLGF